MTITMFRHAYPRKLFQHLKITGADIIEESTVVYRIDGLFYIPIRVIVTEYLGPENAALRVLSKNVSNENIRRFSEQADNLNEKGEQANIEAVFEVSVAANQNAYTQAKEKKIMGPALYDLFKDDLDAAEKNGQNQIIERMLQRGKTPEAISDFVGFPVSDILRVQANMNAVK